MSQENIISLSLWEKLALCFSLLILAMFFVFLCLAQKPYPLAVFQANDQSAKIAQFWERRDLGVRCNLCPNFCYLPEGARGKCKVRLNRNNQLYTEVWGRPVVVNVDPIEKKPVFHMLPGSSILSISTVGCPLSCSFCQNWTLSQAYPEEVKESRIVPPREIVDSAVRNRIPALAFTYGEPVIFYEYMLEIARLGKAQGLRNVMVTSGFINPEPLRKLAPYLDVVKVDLKGMSEEFYRAEVGGNLQSVLDTLKTLKELKVFTEVVNLVVPNRNDREADFERLTRWIYKNLGPDTPLFFSRFHPDYKLTNLPPTPVETLEKARQIARKNGLYFVYLGNVPGHEGENTCCPEDGTLLIEREGFLVKKNMLNNGCCPVCERRIPGIWN